MQRIIRIGNAGGYWGDDLDALKRQLTQGPLDYITMDFLAEITMSILQRQRQKNSELGYATDFVNQMEECLPILVEKKVRLITNAGGINPIGLGRKLVELAQRKKLNVKIGVVSGDDIVQKLDQLYSSGEKMASMETGESFTKIQGRVTAANVYFGAEPVVKALNEGCQIIVTGRVTDTGITLAPMIHEFGWAYDDWDKIAAGVIAGHIIECGAQSTGGNLTDWEEVKSFHNIGYPIIEMSSSGEFIVTKHHGTGGKVSEKSVKEQLVYEMGDPANYIAPDGIACFDTIQLQDLSKDRVRVFGVKGKPAPQLLKVSMAYDDGFKISGTLLVSGPGIQKKVKTISDIFWKKLEHKYEETRTELVGGNSIWPPTLYDYEPNEGLLRLSASDSDYQKLDDLGKKLSSLILAGPSGMAVSTGGRPKPSQVVAYWPALVSREATNAEVTVLDTDGGEKHWIIPLSLEESAAPVKAAASKTKSERASFSVRTKATRLLELCYARSGDKGDTCNIGLLARSPEIYQWLDKYLTAARVKSFFNGITHGKVTRYKLGNLLGFNFLLERTLGGGGTKSLMVDPQGKTLSQALLQMVVPAPVSLLKSPSKKKK